MPAEYLDQYRFPSRLTWGYWLRLRLVPDVVAAGGRAYYLAKQAYRVVPAARFNEAVAARWLLVVEKTTMVFLKCPAPAPAAGPRPAARTIRSSWPGPAPRPAATGVRDSFYHLVAQFGVAIQSAARSLASNGFRRPGARLQPSRRRHIADVWRAGGCLS